MSRQRIMKWLDGLSFAGFVFLVATGCVLHFVLPPGSGRLVGERTGFRAAQKPTSLLWGMTAHRWGSLHYWIAVVFMAVLAVHLLLHGRFLICLVKGRPSRASPIRAGLGVVGALFFFALAAAPFFSPKAMVERRQLQGRYGIHNPDVSETVKEHDPGHGAAGDKPCEDSGAAPCTEHP